MTTNLFRKINVYSTRFPLCRISNVSLKSSGMISLSYVTFLYNYTHKSHGFRNSINQHHLINKVRIVFSFLAHQSYSQYYCVSLVMEAGFAEEFSLHEPSRGPGDQSHPLQIIRIESSGSMRDSTVTPYVEGISNDGNFGNTQVKYSFPQEAWLPITESRNGNVFSAVVHLLSSGIGFQALLLPVAFAALGWLVFCQYKCSIFNIMPCLNKLNVLVFIFNVCRLWGIISLSLAFAWQLYTIWLLVQLAESVPGPRYSRYLLLAISAFG